MFNVKTHITRQEVLPIPTRAWGKPEICLKPRDRHLWQRLPFPLIEPTFCHSPPDTALSSPHRVFHLPTSLCTLLLLALLDGHYISSSTVAPTGGSFVAICTLLRWSPCIPFVQDHALHWLPRQRGEITVCLVGSIVRLSQDSTDMVLTRQGSSRRDPDKFPTTQLFLLGVSTRHHHLSAMYTDDAKQHL